jgi:hypothetical protein
LTGTVEYVYCVVPATLVLSNAPHGIDRAPVRRIVRADVAALVTELDADEYSGDAPSERMGDPEWLTPRAVAHDAVITWAADRGAVVPFAMWAMFSDERAVSEMARIVASLAKASRAPRPRTPSSSSGPGTEA